MRRAFLDSACGHALAFCIVFFGAPVALIVACYVYLYNLYSMLLQGEFVGATRRQKLERVLYVRLGVLCICAPSIQYIQLCWLKLTYDCRCVKLETPGLSLLFWCTRVWLSSSEPST